MLEDMVKKPKHYMFEIDGKETQAIDIVKGLLTEEEFRGFIKGSYYTYLMRADRKNGLEDLQKAKTYLDWQIELDQGKELTLPGKEIKIPGTLCHNDYEYKIYDASRNIIIKQEDGINLEVKVLKGEDLQEESLRKYELTNINFKDSFNSFNDVDNKEFGYTQLKMAIPILSILSESRMSPLSILPKGVGDGVSIIIKIYEDSVKVDLTKTTQGKIYYMKLCVDLIIDGQIKTLHIESSTLKNVTKNTIFWEDLFTGVNVIEDMYRSELTDMFANFIVNVAKENISFEDNKNVKE